MTLGDGVSETTPGSQAVDETRFLGGRLVLRQPRRGHRAGTDAALVIAAARHDAGGRIADLGAGVGTIGLALAVLSPKAEVLLVEMDSDLVALAGENALLNDCAGRVSTLTADVQALPVDPHERVAERGTFDLVVMNPPFTDALRSPPSPDPARARAYHMAAGGLDRWVDAAAMLLRPGGRLVLIHRPDALARVLAALDGGFGGVALRPVHPHDDDPATRVLVEARKDGRAPLTVAPPLVLHERSGVFTSLAADIHRGEIALPFSRPGQ